MSLCYVSDSWYHDVNKAVLIPNNEIADRRYIVCIAFNGVENNATTAQCQLSKWFMRNMGKSDKRNVWILKVGRRIRYRLGKCRALLSADQERMTKEQWAHDDPQIKNQDWGNCKQKIGWCVCVYICRKKRKIPLYLHNGKGWMIEEMGNMVQQKKIRTRKRKKTNI